MSWLHAHVDDSFCAHGMRLLAHPINRQSTCLPQCITELLNLLSGNHPIELIAGFEDARAHHQPVRQIARAR
jgi:hypothetical protein